MTTLMRESRRGRRCQAPAVTRRYLDPEIEDVLPAWDRWRNRINQLLRLAVTDILLR